MATYHVVCNRVEGSLCQTDDIVHAGRVVDALMRTRDDPKWCDYWVVDDHGNEFYHDAGFATVFSAACFVEKAA